MQMMYYVQVHPDDAYAKIHANDLGKTECWYILDAEPGAQIILGHNAPTKEAFIEQIKNNEWHKLFKVC